MNKFSEGVFYAVLVCNNGGNEKEIDSRTSDAIALALRFKCPIYTYENIMIAAGILIDEEAEKTRSIETLPIHEEEEEHHFTEYALDDLNQMLQTAIENEEYEKASRIRDEIKRRG